MSTSMSFLSRTDSLATRTSSLSEGEGEGGGQGQGGGHGHGGARKGSSDVQQAEPVGGRGSFLYNFLKQGKHLQ